MVLSALFEESQICSVLARTCLVRGGIVGKMAGQLTQPFIVQKRSQKFLPSEAFFLKKTMSGHGVQSCESVSPETGNQALKFLALLSTFLWSTARFEEIPGNTTFA